jgi:hypothetical protein
MNWDEVTEDVIEESLKEYSESTDLSSSIFNLARFCGELEYEGFRLLDTPNEDEVTVDCSLVFDGDICVPGFKLTLDDVEDEFDVDFGLALADFCISGFSILFA